MNNCSPSSTALSVPFQCKNTSHWRNICFTCPTCNFSKVIINIHVTYQANITTSDEDKLCIKICCLVVTLRVQKQFNKASPVLLKFCNFREWQLKKSIGRLLQSSSILPKHHWQKKHSPQIYKYSANGF